MDIAVFDRLHPLPLEHGFFEFVLQIRVIDLEHLYLVSKFDELFLQLDHLVITCLGSLILLIVVADHSTKKFLLFHLLDSDAQLPNISRLFLDDFLELVLLVDRALHVGDNCPEALESGFELLPLQVEFS